MKKPLSAYCNSSSCSPKKNYISSVGVKKDVLPRTLECPDCRGAFAWLPTKSKYRAGNNKTQRAKPVNKNFIYGEAEIDGRCEEK